VDLPEFKARNIHKNGNGGRTSETGEELSRGMEVVGF
jgi:hypothetical protein